MKTIERFKTFRDQGKLEKAIEYSSKLNLEQQTAEFLSILAHVYFLKDQVDKAQNLLKIAIEKDRDCSLVIWSTTRLYLKEQKYNEALKLITIGLQNFKNDLE